MRAGKYLFSAAKRETMALKSEDARSVSLEEAFNWNDYPKQKVVATGYTAGVESTGKTKEHHAYGITYSGVKVKRDLYSTVAADPTVFRLERCCLSRTMAMVWLQILGKPLKVISLIYTMKPLMMCIENGVKSARCVYHQKGEGTLTEKDLNQLNEAESMQVFRQQFQANKE